MMCSRLLRPTAEQGRFVRFLDRLFDRLKNRFQHRLHRTLEFRAMTILILVAVMAMTAVLYVTTPQELAPEEDQGIVFTLVKTPQYANLDYLERATMDLYRIFEQVPEQAHVFTINEIGSAHV